MTKFIIAGYKLSISPMWKDVTTLADPFDPDIIERPATKEMDAIIYEEGQAIEAVRKYFAPSDPPQERVPAQPKQQQRP